MRARSNGLREQRVARQIEIVLAQEEALDRRRDGIREREDLLARREEELARRGHQLELGWSERVAALERREHAVEARERAVAERAAALEETARRKARSLAEEAVSRSGRNREVAWRAQVVKAVVPDPEQEAGETAGGSSGDDTGAIVVEPPVPDGGWNLNRIERLVEAAADANPGRAEEWRYYLLYLREFAEIGGALPRSFDRLVWDAFGDLLRQQAAGAAA
jgi:hypothetical protein